MEDLRNLQRKDVCDNNCKPIKSVVENITNGSNHFKYIDIFEGDRGLATIPLHKHMDYCCAPFKNRKELFEALDRLRENNSESTDFEENETEKILYRMFSLDYSSSFNIDGVATDVFGKQFVLVSLDDNQDTNLPCTIDSDGMLKSKEDPEKYKDCFSKERKLKKDHIRDLLKQIALLNSDINDLSINNKTNYYELLEEEKEVNRLKEEVWNLYSEEGEYTSEPQSETGLPLSGSLDTKRAWSYFEKAVSKGWIANEGNKLTWQGIGGKAHLSQLAYFCGRVYDYKYSVNGNTGTEFPTNELEELFGVKNLYSLLRQVHEAKGKQKWRACIDELFE